MYQASQYNYFVPYRDKIIYYNSLHRSRFAMTMAEHQRIRKLFEDPISFSLEYPSVFAQFYQWGFFVDAYTNETAIFRYLYNRDVIFSSHYHLVLANTPQHELSSAFKVPLVKHIKHMLDSKATVSEFNRQQDLTKKSLEAYKMATTVYDINKQRFIIGKSDVNTLTLSLNRKDNAHRNYLSALNRYWILYYKLRKLTLFDFEKKEKLSIEI